MSNTITQENLINVLVRNELIKKEELLEEIRRLHKEYQSRREERT